MDEDELKTLLEDVAACPAYGEPGYEEHGSCEQARRPFRFHPAAIWLRRLLVPSAVTVWLYEVIHLAVRR